MPFQIIGSNFNNNFQLIKNLNIGGISFLTNTVSSSALYTFSTFTFTNAGAIGRNGPTFSEMLIAYTGSANWAATASYFTSSIRGIQNWTVPETAIYRVTAAGAKGGNSPSVNLTGGLGAIIVTDLSFSQGQILSIVVGQSGSNRSTVSTFNGGSGGGGTFIYDSSSITYYVAVGGGGGAGGSLTSILTNQLTASGKFNSTSGSSVRIANNYFASGGLGGNGGGRSNRNILYGGPGAGINSSGSSANNTQGLSRINNWLGGSTGSTANTNAREGGFGGGGAAGDGDASSDGNTISWAGGGGGYSGGAAGGNGGASDSQYGGGGGSYYIGTFVSGASNWNNGHGYVIITKL